MSSLSAVERFYLRLSTSRGVVPVASFNASQRKQTFSEPAAVLEDASDSAMTAGLDLHFIAHAVPGGSIVLESATGTQKLEDPQILEEKKAQQKHLEAFRKAIGLQRFPAADAFAKFNHPRPAPGATSDNSGCPICSVLGQASAGASSRRCLLCSPSLAGMDGSTRSRSRTESLAAIPHLGASAYSRGGLSEYAQKLPKIFSAPVAYTPIPSVQQGSRGAAYVEAPVRRPEVTLDFSPPQRHF